MEHIELITILGALSDPVRLHVVKQLADAGGVVQGAFDVHVTGQTLSHHLKVLVDAGVVRVTQEGRFRRCELRFAEVEEQFPGLLTAIMSNLGEGL